MLTTERCRVCSGDAVVVFSRTVLEDVVAEYARCQDCRSLFAVRPTWLDRAYHQRTWMPGADIDALTWQRRFAWPVISTIMSPAPSLTLDWGAGNGWLMDRLLDAGHDAWGLDKYRWPMATEEAVSRVVRSVDVAPRPCAMVSALEVLEHLLCPGEAMQQMAALLAPLGVLVASTVLYNDEGDDWFYLMPQHGQHVTFMSSLGFALSTKRAGLRWQCTIAGQLPNERKYPIHLLSNGDFDRALLSNRPEWAITWHDAP